MGDDASKSLERLRAAKSAYEEGLIDYALFKDVQAQFAINLRSNQSDATPAPRSTDLQSNPYDDEQQAVPNGYHDDDNYGGDDDDFDERERRDGPAVKTALQYAIDDARRGDIRKRVLTGSRSLGSMHAVLLYIGQWWQVGMYMAPALVVADVHSGGAALLVWLMTVGFCLMTMICQVELMSAIPSAAGDYLYIHRAFGHSMGAVFTMTQLVSLVPAGLALHAMVFAQLVLKLAEGREASDPELKSGMMVKVLASVFVFVLVLFNFAVGAKGTAVAHIIGTILKITVTAAVVVFGGAYFVAVESSNQVQHLGDLLEPSTIVANTNARGFVVALTSAAWGLDGFGKISFMVEDLKRPKVQAASLTYIAVGVLGAKVLLFVTFLMLLLKKHVMEETHLVLGDFVDRTVSTIVRQVMEVLLVVIAVVSMHTRIVDGTRVLYASATDGLMPRFFERLAPTHAPTWPLLLQLVFAVVMIMSMHVEQLIVVWGTALWLSRAIIALTLLRLRSSAPDLPRIVRVPHPWLPLAIVVIAALAVVLLVVERPIDGGIGVSLAVLAIPLSHFLKQSNIADASEQELLLAN